MKTGVYCRTSGDLDSSIEQQQIAGIAFCKANNWDFEIYKDEGVSGYRKYVDKNKKPEVKKTDDDDDLDDPLNREGFSDLLHDIKQKKIDKVWVWEQSRLSRRNRDTENILYMFQKHNIELWEKDKKIDLDDPQTKLLRGVIGAFSEFERSLTVGRTTRGLKHIIDNGERSYQAFYGYESVSKNKEGKAIWQIVESQLNVVKFTYQELLKGSSYKKILYSLYDNRFVSLEEYKSLQRRLIQIIRHFEYTGYTWNYEGSKIYQGILKGKITDILFLNNPKYYVPCLAYPEQIVSIKDWFFIFEKSIIRKRVIDARKESHLKTASTGMSTGIIELLCPR